jgi:uncharacterized membrane protein
MCIGLESFLNWKIKMKRKVLVMGDYYFIFILRNKC